MGVMGEQVRVMFLVGNSVVEYLNCLLCTGLYSKWNGSVLLTRFCASIGICRIDILAIQSMLVYVLLLSFETMELYCHSLLLWKLYGAIFQSTYATKCYRSGGSLQHYPCYRDYIGLYRNQIFPRWTKIKEFSKVSWDQRLTHIARTFRALMQCAGLNYLRLVGSTVVTPTQSPTPTQRTITMLLICHCWITIVHLCPIFVVLWKPTFRTILCLIYVPEHYKSYL